MSEIITWREAREAFEALLDEMHPPLNFGFVKVHPSTALREADPIAYRQGLLDFLDAEGVDSDDLEGADE